MPLFAAGFSIGAFFFFFYQGSYDPPPPVEIPFVQLHSPASQTTDFVDTPVVRGNGGTLLVDATHRNNFDGGEIITLRSRVADRGYNIEFIGDFNTTDEATRIGLLEDKLREADSYAVIVPRDAYTEAETNLVARFVDQGGKLLLIGDPTRRFELNALAESFGLEFQPDYLYNTTEFDLNFQHIFLREFQPDPITSGLNEITLYTAASIRSTGSGLAFTDGNTKSTVVESNGNLTPLVKGDKNNVLAVGDLTFMVPPQNSLLDNNRLISNIADYLTESERTFTLNDFPYFLHDRVDILLGQASLIEAGITVKSDLTTLQVISEMQGTEDLTRDTVFLGLYEDAIRVQQYLQVAGIEVSETLNTPFTPELELDRTAITVLSQSQDRDLLIVLADSPDTLQDAIERLASGNFRDDLVSELIGVSKSS